MERIIALDMDDCHSRQLRPKTMQSYEQALKLFTAEYYILIHNAVYYFMLLEVMAAVGLVYGSIDLTDLPQTEPMDSDSKPWNFGIHPGFIKKLSALLEEELDVRKSTIPVKIAKSKTSPT